MRSLRTRLATLLAAIVALGLLVNAAWLVLSARQRLRERLTQAPDPMHDLLAQLSQRLGATGLAPREYLRWVQASVGQTLRR